MAKLKINTNLRNMRDNKRCFKLGDYAILIFGIFIAFLPIINFYQVGNNGRYNVVAWDEFYTSSLPTETTGYSNYQTNITEGQYVRSIARAGSTMVNIVGESYEEYDVGGYRRTTVIMNGTSDLEFSYEYDFNNAKIYNILFNTLCPIRPLYSVRNYHANTDDIILEGGIGYIPSNWSGFWDNVEIIMYIVDDTNNGIGYNFGRNASVSKSDFREKDITSNGNILSIKVYDMDMSSYFDGTTNTFNCKPYDTSDELFLNEEIINGYGLINLITSGIGDNVAFSNVLINSKQFYGYYEPFDLPLNQRMSKLGFYIKVNKEFNILNGTGMADMKDYFTTPSGQVVTFRNGFVFEESNINVGKIVGFKRTIENIVMFDILVICAGIGVITLIYLMPTKELKSYTKEYKEKCFIQKTVYE